MSKKKIIVTGILFVVLFFVILCFIGIRDYRLYNRDKPNIFEIPGTARMHCIESLDFYQYQCHFMVQKLPEQKSEVKAMIEDFLEDTVVRELFKRDSKTTTLSLYFYVPSMNFPVYYEENKNYFKMDDYISHYEDNLFLVVSFDSSGEATMMFKETTLERLKISE